LCSTLHELLDESAALSFMDAGVPAVAGLRTGLACAAALAKPPADPARLREIAAATRRAAGSAPTAGSGSAPDPTLNGRRWLSEHEAKQLLRRAGVAVVDGRVVADEDDAVLALSELGGHVAVKLSAPSVQHKAELGALSLDVCTEEEMREAHRRLGELGIEDAAVLVERMAPPGLELIVAARADGVVPCVVVGAGGIWTEALDDVAIVPLPASPDGVERAMRRLRAARAGSAASLDLAAAAALAARAGELLVEHGLELLELNPVRVDERGAMAVDAVAATAP
jgi:acetate---CoA ligase (ADP-forming)